MSTAAQLRSADVTERLAALAEVHRRGVADAAELQALLACLGDHRKIVQRRAAETLATLTESRSEVEEALRRALRSGTSRQRWGAAFTLSLLDATPAIALPVLLDALGTEDGDIRWAAGNILTRMRGMAPVIDALREMVTRGNAPQRKMAIYCLRDLDARSPAVEAAVLSALDDHDTHVRIAGVSCLVRLASDRGAVARHLIRLTSDNEATVRRVAAAVLGLLGERSEAVDTALRAAASSADPALRRAAERSLRLLNA